MFVQRHTTKKWIKNDAVDVSIKWDEGEVFAHCHEFYELEVILDGEGSYVVDGKTYQMERGALFFMSPISFHKLSYCRRTKLINVMFPVDSVNEELLGSICPDFAHFYTVLNESDIAFFVMLAENLIKFLSGESKQEKIIFISYLHCLLAKVAELAEKGVPARLPEPIERALVWIHSNFKNRVSIADVARVANYSSHYFCEVFKKYMGRTLHCYLEELRFSHARNLLRYSQMTVTQICYECGFTDYAHFTQRFKLRYGVTPSRYRRREEG